MPGFQSHFYMISGHCHKTTGKYRKQCNKKDHIQQTSAFPAITMKAIRLYSRFHLSHPLHPPNIHKQKKAGSSGSILSLLYKGLLSQKLPFETVYQKIQPDLILFLSTQS